METQTVKKASRPHEETGNKKSNILQPGKPDPALKHLEVFVGKWNTEGETTDDQSGAVKKITGTSTTEWMDGGFFLIQRWDVRIGGEKNTGFEIIGYDTSSKAYISHYYHSIGLSQEYQLTVQGNTWRYKSDSERCKLVVSDDGNTLSAKWEKLNDDSKWVSFCEMKATRAR